MLCAIKCNLYKNVYFPYFSIEVCYLGCDLWKIIIVSNNGFSKTRRKAII